jgi:hypothetical protein
VFIVWFFVPALLNLNVSFRYYYVPGFSYFLRMLGPAIGYALASLCLKIYISPSLTPTVTMDDPRWLGAWWLGKQYEPSSQNYCTC